MRRMHIVHMGILCLGIFLNAAAAEGGREAMSFSNARQRIRAANGELKAADMQTQAAREGIDQASVLPNPGVGLGLEKFGLNEMEASVEQTIELGGKRHLRKEHAQKQFEAVSNEQTIKRLELEAEIVRRFIPIATTEAKLSMLDSIIAAADSTRARIERRVTVGAARQTDFIRAEIDIEQLRLEREELLRANKQARKGFAALGGEDDAALERVSGTIAYDSDLPPMDTLRAALNANPHLSALTLDQQILQTREKQLGARVVPDLGISAGYVYNNIENEGAPVIGISAEIPLFNRQSAARKQLSLQAQAFTYRRETMLRLLDAQLQDLHSTVGQIDNGIETLTRSTIPRAQEVYAMMRKYYNTGNGTFQELSATQADMLRLRMDLVALKAQRASVLTDIMLITVTEIEIIN